MPLETSRVPIWSGSFLASSGLASCAGRRSGSEDGEQTTRVAYIYNVPSNAWVSTIFPSLRAQFPVTESLIYLNHAAVAPLVRPAAEAMKRFSDDGMLYGSLHYRAVARCV